MNLDLTYEPLLAWDGPLRSTWDRERSPFSATWGTTLADLDREARALVADRVFIRLAYPPGAFRLDGALRGDFSRREPEHPGVVVVLATRSYGNLTYATDCFDRWRDNVRAIVLGLESLRRVERYGIADRGQQYAGFRELGSGVALGKPQPLTLDEAAALLAGAVANVSPADVLAGPESARLAYRQALRVLHPDHGGSGDGARMARLAEAWALVKAHHRIG